MDEKDRGYFERLGLKNVLDLALVLPKSFEDTSLMLSPHKGQGVVEVQTKGYQSKRGFLSVETYCSSWEKPITLVIFNAKPFHYASFKANKTLYVLGKVQFAFGKWQMVQPKIISKVGVINPRYKTPLKNPSVVNLIKKYVTAKNLDFLEPKMVELLLKIHRNDKESVRLLSDGVFEKEVLPSLKYLEIFNYLSKLSKKKVDFPSSSRLKGDESEFVSSLPFSLTDDQKKAIADIKTDLQSKSASRRVIMGDVGCGKTMVIFAAVMMAYPKKAILMSPTTILASQIYEEALKYLPKKLNICLVTSKDKGEELDAYDFIIGTHALLYKTLPKCDLVMIDEQHRFGTNQRHLIHTLVSSGKSHPHFLQFSATPIPRTLSMINATVVKHSFIRQMPFPKDISTFIIGKNNFAKLLSHIDEQIAQKHQVIIIYPLVEESETSSYQSLEEGRGFWEKRYKNVFVTHGKDKQKEEVLKTFRQNGDILLATTVVEVGISLPKLSSIVIVGAERLGLASLHQLRGRVSRNGLKGYCYLFTYSKNLERLKDFASTNDGFKIAELDLKHRQGGDMLDGLAQHGVSFRYFDPKEDEEVLKKAKRDLGLVDKDF